MMRPLKLLSGNERGTTIIEFALIAPVLMLVMMGFFDMGHEVYARSVLTGAIQKAARDSTI